MAAELARHGIQVRIFDQNTGPSTTSRAIAIHARTLEILTDMGAVEPVLAAGYPIHGVSIFAESKRIVHLAFDELESPYRYAIDLPQSKTEAILTAHLDRLGIEVERRTALGVFTTAPDGVTAHLRRQDGSMETANASYLIGCDGSNSTVRHTLGVPFEGSTREEHFIVADVHLDWDQPADEWTLWFHEDGLLTSFPLPNNLYRLIANAPDGANTFDAVLRIWNERASTAAKPRNPHWIANFRIGQRIVPTYRHGRVFLAGDAAHIHSPAGGQGMNTGIQDAYNLAWKLALVLKGESPDSLLDSYTAEREPVGRGVLELSGGIGSLATMRHTVSQSLRNRILSTLVEFEVIQQRLVNRLGETSVNYRRSPIVSQQGRWYASAPMPGDRAPDLGEPFRDPRFKVLLFPGEEPEGLVLDDFRTTLRYMTDGYPHNVVTYLVPRVPTSWMGRVLDDPDGQIHYRYGAGLPCAYILRPDNYVSFRTLGTHPLPILDHLGTLLNAEPSA